MVLSVNRIADRVAADRSIGEYDLWRMRRKVEHELFVCRRRREPLPIDLLYARRIIITAQMRRRDPFG